MQETPRPVIARGFMDDLPRRLPYDEPNTFESSPKLLEQLSVTDSCALTPKNYRRHRTTRLQTSESGRLQSTLLASPIHLNRPPHRVAKAVVATPKCRKRSMPYPDFTRRSSLSLALVDEPSANLRRRPSGSHALQVKARLGGWDALDPSSSTAGQPSALVNHEHPDEYMDPITFTPAVPYNIFRHYSRRKSNLRASTTSIDREYKDIPDFENVAHNEQDCHQLTPRFSSDAGTLCDASNAYSLVYRNCSSAFAKKSYLADPMILSSPIFKSSSESLAQELARMLSSCQIRGDQPKDAQSQPESISITPSVRNTRVSTDTILTNKRTGHPSSKLPPPATTATRRFRTAQSPPDSRRVIKLPPNDFTAHHAFVGAHTTPNTSSSIDFDMQT